MEAAVADEGNMVAAKVAWRWSTARTEVCGACRFYEPGDLGSRYGACKRYPTDLRKALDDYCGEFRGQPEAAR